MVRGGPILSIFTVVDPKGVLQDWMWAVREREESVIS